MRRFRSRFHIGLRTAKTAAAIIISMLIVESLGTTTSKLIFAMLGAMTAVQPTFKASVEACLAQIVGVLFGAVASVLLLLLPLHPLVSTGIGIILVITLYNTFGIRFSPSLSCFIVVMMCNTPDIQPMTYAFGRIWDTAIGLGIGMLINTLVFPYDNSRRIRETVKGLDKQLLDFLEDLFDGDDVLPDEKQMTATINDMNRQLTLFSDQKLILNLRRQQHDLEVFRACEGKAKELVARMVVLSRVEKPGILTPENKAKLLECGADIRDERTTDDPSTLDIVTNYHIRQILTLRQELLDALNK